MFKKILSMTLALAMALAMFTTAFAASGYDLTKVDKVTGTAVAEVTTKAVDKAAEAKAPVAYVPFFNAKEVTPDAFKKVADEAAKKNVEAKVMADTVVNGVVQVRVILDPKLALAQNKSINMSGSIGHAQTKNLFNHFFVNELVVVDLGQSAAYGQNVEIAARLDVSKLDSAKPWFFYSYDPVKNEYRRIPAPNYKMDANGYLHFNTTLADKVLITDMPMTAR